MLSMLPILDAPLITSPSQQRKSRVIQDVARTIVNPALKTMNHSRLGDCNKTFSGGDYTDSKQRLSTLPDQPRQLPSADKMSSMLAVNAKTGISIGRNNSLTTQMALITRRDEVPAHRKGAHSTKSVTD